jgi:hypothetical protein
MTQYLELKNLKLSDKLVKTISDIDWHSMKPAHYAGPWQFLRAVLRYCYKNKVMPCIFFSEGWPGTVITYKLPQLIEDAIALELQAVTHVMKEQPIIRLQVIYGGCQIAMHTDVTRNVSLVYPISNHSSARTTFYKESPIKSKDRFSMPGVVNPTNCVLDDYVIIDKHPVMFDVSKPHSVNYAKGTLTKQNPRISVGIKWQHSTFNQIAKHF